MPLEMYYHVSLEEMHYQAPRPCNISDLAHFPH